MTAQDVIKVMAAMSDEELLALQREIAATMASRFYPDDVTEINQALDEADAEFARGEGMDSAELRRRLGLR